MSLTNTLYQTFNRYRTLYTDHIHALPIVILMPHSACNCRCIMCDIWKDNKNLRQLTERDITGLLDSLERLHTQQVLMSGGEALLNPNFFRLCEILKTRGIRVSLLSTGMTIKKNVTELLQWVNDIIVSLDGDEATHDQIRNIPGAYQKLREGVGMIKLTDPGFRITSRTVIHRLNFRKWPQIIQSAMEIGIDQVSFLPADVSSQAFNREEGWTEDRQQDILLREEDLPELDAIIENIIAKYHSGNHPGYIAEDASKLRKIYQYYAAYYGKNAFPFKKCNAPWVSVVVEADGTVRPCFFHAAIGNIRESSLDSILNGERGIRFRKELDMDKNSTCVKCVCYLHLSPKTKLS